MSKKEVYVEQRPDHGDYAVRKPDSARASKVFDTQKEAADWANEHFPDHAVHIERVRNTKVGGRDKWRT